MRLGVSMKLYYKNADPKYVKFQRIMMGWLAIASLFSREIDLIWIFFGITFLGLFTGTAFSLPTLLYKILHTVFKHDLVRVSTHHLRYYQINTSMDLIDHILRLMASSAALVLYYNNLEVLAWGVISFLSVFMMLSAYFGFCLSALAYVTLENVREKFNLNPSKKCTIQHIDTKLHQNKNCILAKQHFTPYKRCDSCHITIGRCLGTKFNSLVLIIGLLMALFLFIDDHIFIQINIILIMALIFWFGYQVNYNTDALAKSNDENITLNKQLKSYTESLEAEVRKRTAKIEHMATHDMLTDLYNRFSFEKLLINALETLDNSSTTHLAFLDLDKFKLINDTAGHLAGDQLLCNMSELLTTCVGDKGSVARLGGDEFAILFQGISQADALKCCQDICDQAKRCEFKWEEHSFHIGTSIGLVTVESSMQDIKAVIHHADQACYVAKKSGRNQVHLKI